MIRASAGVAVLCLLEACAPSATIARLPVDPDTRAVVLVFLQDGVKALFAGEPGAASAQEFKLPSDVDDGSPVEVVALLYKKPLSEIEIQAGRVPIVLQPGPTTIALPRADSTLQAVLSRGGSAAWSPMSDPQLDQIRIERTPSECVRWSAGVTLSSTLSGVITAFLPYQGTNTPAEQLLLVVRSAESQTSFRLVSLSGLAPIRPLSLPIQSASVRSAMQDPEGDVWIPGRVLPAPGAAPPYDTPYEGLLRGSFDLGFNLIPAPTPPELLDAYLLWMAPGRDGDRGIYAMTDNGSIVRQENGWELMRRGINLKGRNTGAILWARMREVFAVYPYDAGQASASLIHLSPAGEKIVDTDPALGASTTLLQSAVYGIVAGTTLGRELEFDPATETWPPLPESSSAGIVALVELRQGILALTDDGQQLTLEQRAELGACPSGMRAVLPIHLRAARMLRFGDGIAVAGFNAQAKLTVLFMTPAS